MARSFPHRPWWSRLWAATDPVATAATGCLSLGVALLPGLVAYWLALHAPWLVALLVYAAAVA